MSLATHPSDSPARQRLGIAAAAGSLLLLTACSSSSSAGPAPADLHGQLPDPVRSSGVLRVGTDLKYAPIGFKTADGKPDGLDVDLANALGQVLGVKVQFAEVPFERLFLGLQGREFDVVMSGMTDNLQRRDGTDAKGMKMNSGVDFVDYFVTGTSIVVAKGNPQKISTLDDLCGRTVALQRDTVQAVLAERQAVVCEKAHKKLTLQQTDTDDQALALVAQGKAAADLSDTPAAAYAAQQGRGGAQFQVTGEQMQAGPYGIVVSKEDTVLRDTLVKALDRVIRSGDYDKILAKWGLSAGAAQNAVVNGGF
ncbi:ABC transporter substrate-binding protein [Kitasatospora sp. NPDC092948]|uniref:ABC transporter substrate-binding protein n=1 Tax=Kitasatospora sp. NPDC092948 TaxID=3364088 RepID=UPI003822837F